jgi:hypothetical protein
MKLKTKRKLIDEINDAFIDIIAQEKNKEYAKFIENINRDLINNIDQFSLDYAKTVINKYNIRMEDVALYFLMLSYITTIVEKQRLTRKEQESLAPIIAVVSVIGFSNPKKLVKTIVNTNNGTKVNPKLKPLLNQIKRDRGELIKNIAGKQEEQIKASQYKAKLSMSKDILNEAAEMRAKGFGDDKTRRLLLRKYNNDNVVNRALDTELHANAELAKNEAARAEGYEFKIWKTQGDNRVRKTNWHKQVANKKIPIEESFRVGNMVADYPGDMRLPPGERIRCRCYLIYV